MNEREFDIAASVQSVERSCCAWSLHHGDRPDRSLPGGGWRSLRGNAGDRETPSAAVRPPAAGDAGGAVGVAHYSTTRSRKARARLGATLPGPSTRPRVAQLEATARSTGAGAR